jgi:hypothetical protein
LVDESLLLRQCHLHEGQSLIRHRLLPLLGREERQIAQVGSKGPDGRGRVMLADEAADGSVS